LGFSRWLFQHEPNAGGCRVFRGHAALLCFGVCRNTASCVYRAASAAALLLLPSPSFCWAIRVSPPTVTPSVFSTLFWVVPPIFWVLPPIFCRPGIQTLFSPQGVVFFMGTPPHPFLDPGSRDRWCLIRPPAGGTHASPRGAVN